MDKKARPGDPGLATEKPQGLVAATTAATTAAAVITTTAAAGRTLFAGLGDIDREFASVHLPAVEGCDGVLRFFGSAHGDETKSAGAAGFAVHHQVDFSDRPVRGERVLEVVLGGIEGKVSNKHFVAHVMFYCPALTVTFFRLFPNVGSKIITERTGSPEDYHALKETSYRTDMTTVAVSGRIAKFIIS